MYLLKIWTEFESLIRFNDAISENLSNFIVYYLRYLRQLDLLSSREILTKFIERVLNNETLQKTVYILSLLVNFVCYLIFNDGYIKIKNNLQLWTNYNTGTVFQGCLTSIYIELQIMLSNYLFTY